MSSAPDPNDVQLDIRERIYWATSALAFLDTRGRQESPVHSLSSSIESQTDACESRVKALNHFCILLSRGIKEESNYSVLAGPTLAQSLSIVVVISRTYNNPRIKPHDQTYDECTRIDRQIIPPTQYAKIDDLLDPDPTVTIDFHHYIHMAIRVLKWGAEHHSLQDQVSFFFLSHCFPKVKRRFTSVERTYFHDNSLAEWKYQHDDESFADSKIHVGHPGLQKVLRKLGIPQDNRNHFDFTEELSTQWFQAILKLCEYFRRGFDDGAPDIGYVVHASTMSSMLLRKIPRNFWRLKSLNILLGKSRYHAEARWRTENKRDIPDSPLGMSSDSIDTPPSTRAHRQTNLPFSEQDTPLRSEDEAEIEEWETLLLNSDLVEKLEKQCIPFQSRLFVASLESVNSWTRAVASICRRRYLCRAQINVDLKIIELPGSPLYGPKPSDVGILLRRWAQWLSIGQLSSFQAILEAVCASATPRLGCHSEAIIMAAFLSKETTKLQVLPPTIRKAFRDIVELNRDHNHSEPDYVPIGVSRPLCATCRFFERSLFWSARISFGCASRTGICEPWMPPSWIPQQNLIELESALLDKLMDKLPHTTW